MSWLPPGHSLSILTCFFRNGVLGVSRCWPPLVTGHILTGNSREWSNPVHPIEDPCFEESSWMFAACCFLRFSAYELENDCTYTYPLTYRTMVAVGERQIWPLHTIKRLLTNRWHSHEVVMFFQIRKTEAQLKPNLAIWQTCFDWFEALIISTNAGNKKKLAQLGMSSVGFVLRGQFDALFQYDSELMNPSNQDGRDLESRANAGCTSQFFKLGNEWIKLIQRYWNMTLIQDIKKKRWKLIWFAVYHLTILQAKIGFS